MHSKIVVVVLAIVALVAVCTVNAKKRDQPVDDPVALDTLRQVCANENGGHLNEQLLDLNYQKFNSIFEDNAKMDELVNGSYNEFLASVKQEKSAKGGSGAGLTKVLKQHTSRLCGMLESMESIVAGSELSA